MAWIRLVVDIEISQVTSIRRELKYLKSLVIDIFTPDQDPLASIGGSSAQSGVTILPMNFSCIIVGLISINSSGDWAQKAG